MALFCIFAWKYLFLYFCIKIYHFFVFCVRICYFLYFCVKKCNSFFSVKICHFLYFCVKICHFLYFCMKNISLCIFCIKICHFLAPGGPVTKTEKSPPPSSPWNPLQFHSSGRPLNLRLESLWKLSSSWNATDMIEP